MELNQTDLNYLDECASLDGTEIGEYVNCLLELNNMGTPYGMTEIMERDVKAELYHWLKRFKSETVTKTVTELREPVTFKSLEWL